MKKDLLFMTDVCVCQQVIGFLAAVLGKTGTWEDIENNRPQFLLTQIPTQRSKPRKVDIEL